MAGTVQWRRAEGPANWRSRAVLLLLWAIIVLLAFVACVVISAARGGKHGTGDLDLYSGKCSHAKNAHRGLQAALAVIALSLSICFEFFLRLACAPTVADLRRAHRNGRSLDIGIHSLRNMRYISSSRRLLWLFLLLSAISLQVLLHSTTFVISSQTAYSQFIVGQNFTSSGALIYPGVIPEGRRVFNSGLGVRSKFDQLLPGLLSAPSRWDRLEADECREKYFGDPSTLQGHRDVIIVAKAQGWKGAEVWKSAIPSTYPDNAAHEYDPSAVNSLWRFAITCTPRRVDDDSGNMSPFCCSSPYCLDLFEQLIIKTDYYLTPWDSLWTSDKWEGRSLVPFWTPKHINPAFHSLPIDHCLSEPYPAQCKLVASASFLLINMACVLVGCASSALIAWVCWNYESCQVIGDALQAFMKNSDLVIDSSAYKRSHMELSTKLSMTNTTARRMGRRIVTGRLGQVVSLKMWLWTYIPFALFILGVSLASGLNGKLTILSDRSFGESVSNRIFTSEQGNIEQSNQQPATSAEEDNKDTFVGVSLAINMTQLIISIYYLIYSSLYSALFQGKYWAQFSKDSQQLRVSFPYRDQQATHMFQYPFSWGFTFVTVKATLGWLLSQSLYVVPMANVSRWQPAVSAAHVSVYVGYSSRAILAFLILSVCAASFPIIIGFQSLPRALPIVGSDSVAIAAFCQPASPCAETRDAPGQQQGSDTTWGLVWTQRRYMRPLRLGVLKFGSVTEDGPDALGLGIEDEILCLPVHGQRYAPVALFDQGLQAKSFAFTWT